MHRTYHVPLGTQFLEVDIAVQQSGFEDGVDVDELPAHGPPLRTLAGVDKSQSRGLPFLGRLYLSGLYRLDQGRDAVGGKGRDPGEPRAAVAKRVSQVVKHGALVSGL